ncbi:hypothetical protein LAZ67_5000212 [Cordylochernes scorpioides]|uniref:Uncharacterized protein n=1 Tax=Cordylochernes scorpioides TaxID=51811 RepID=A0ABY6KHT7_9ARAC|nr:hypothetical protein LAZ67_5000212 [Cordylochernes scorpioides]
MPLVASGKVIKKAESCAHHRQEEVQEEGKSSFSIYKVMVHSDTGISSKAIMNSFVNDIFERIAGESPGPLQQTITSREIPSAFFCLESWLSTPFLRGLRLSPSTPRQKGVRNENKKKTADMSLGLLQRSTNVPFVE